MLSQLQVVSATELSPKADGLACPVIARYNVNNYTTERKLPLKSKRFRRPILLKGSSQNHMVIVSKYTFVEKKKIGVFCSKCRNRSKPEEKGLGPRVYI